MVMWEKKTIGECAEIISGGTPSTAVPMYWDGGIPWCTPTDITKAKSKYLSATERTISDKGLKDSAAVLLPVGTILLCSRATIGEICIATKPISTNQGFKNLICVSDVDNNFMYYLLQTKVGVMLELAIGSTFLEISKKALASIEIQLPHLPEQRRIAEVLSDTDALLAALEKLITKKHGIKQGVMQELLTGKRRLPEFEGKWETTTLGEFCPNLRKGQIITGSARVEGNIPVVAGGKTVAYYHNAYNRDENTITISASGASAGFVAFWEHRIFASDCSTIESCDNYDVRFVYYYLLSRQADIYAMQTGGAQPHVQPTDLAPMMIKVPEKAEQTAIAEILSDMDAEIDTLTAKLNKLRNIKQGMMSELLTGRIRLAELEPTKATAKVYEKKKTEPVRHVAKNIKHKGHNQQFDDAVMIAGIVDALYDDKYRLGRKKLQKCLYLLRRHQGESTAAFKKKAAGPYADEVRYKGGEPIAKNNNYITTATGKQGTTFARGKNIGKALSYIKRWGKQADIQWVADKFKLKRVEDLELLTTVDMAACELAEAGTLVTVQSIKHLIANNSEWKAKLKKKTFSDTSIAHALRELNTLL
jgi:type I restriction enzyme S subunit